MKKFFALLMLLPATIVLADFITGNQAQLKTYEHTIIPGNPEYDGDLLEGTSRLLKKGVSRTSFLSPML
jgi:hypothetical protein